MRRAAIALAFAGFYATAAAAQENPADMQRRMEAAMAQAQASAMRPGDEALTCDQLQAEFMATMNDPAMQANVAEMGARAQDQQQRVEDARNQAMRQAGVGIVTGIVSSFIPGAGYIQQAQAMAQAQRQQAQAAENQREMMAMGANMEAMLPNVYRGQRLHELAQQKQCPFLQEQGPPQDRGAPQE